MDGIIAFLRRPLRPRISNGLFIKTPFRFLLTFLFQLVCVLPISGFPAEGAGFSATAGGPMDPAMRPPASYSVSLTSYLEIQYPQGTASTARWLMEQGDEILLEVAEQLEVAPPRPIVVRLTPDREAFARAQPGRVPEWAGGTAYPELGLMVLLTRTGLEWIPGQGVEKTYRHELVHLLLGVAFEGKPLPRFLDEGLARLLAYEASIEEFGTLTRAVTLGGLIPFRQLERSFPSDAATAEIAYAQSRHFLSYLVMRFGPEVLPALLERMRAGETFNESLWQVVQQGLTALEEDWRAELMRTHAWVPVLFGGLSLWTLVAVLVVLGALRRRRRSVERRAAWAREEAALEAALAAFQGPLGLTPGDEVVYAPWFAPRDVPSAAESEEGRDSPPRTGEES